MRTRSEAAPALPHADLWTRSLARERGEEKAAQVIDAARAEYASLCAERERPRHRGLRRHLYGNILPQLAVYRVLSRLDGAEAALATTQRLHFTTLAKVKQRHERAANAPMVFHFYRLLVPWMLRVGHPAAGWNIEWAENSSRRIWAKVHKCFYQECLEQYGARELISIYCNGDDHVFGEKPSPHIRWARERTRPRGDAYCDVRYERGANQKGAP